MTVGVGWLSRIIKEIEKAQESVAELVHVQDLREFHAKLKYVKVKSLERALHVKVGTLDYCIARNNSHWVLAKRQNNLAPSKICLNGIKS